MADQSIRLTPTSMELLETIRHYKRLGVVTIFQAELISHMEKRNTASWRNAIRQLSDMGEICTFKARTERGGVGVVIGLFAQQELGLFVDTSNLNQ